MSTIRRDDLIPLMRVRDLLAVLLPDRETPEILNETVTLADVPASALSDPRGFLAVDAVWRLFSARVSVLDDELLGQSTRRVPVGTLELVAARTAHSRTVGEAIEVFAQAVNLVVPDLRVRHWRRLGDIHLSADFPSGMSAARQIYLEIACLPWHCTFCWMSGGLLPVRRFRTGRGRSRVAPQLVATFGSQVEFRGAGIEIVYPAEVAGLPLDVPALDEWRQGMYDALLAQLRGRHEDLASGDLVRYVDHALRHGVTSQEAIATSAGMSVATLRRKLARRNIRFRELRDEILGTDALMLIQAGHDVETVAERLGYSDARSFRRAFQRRFGESPSDYRRRLGGSIPDH